MVINNVAITISYFLTTCIYIYIYIYIIKYVLGQGWAITFLVGRIVTIDMVTEQYIDKCDYFQYVGFIFYT